MKRSSFLTAVAAMVAVPFAFAKSKPKEPHYSLHEHPPITGIKIQEPEPCIFRQSYLLSKEQQEHYSGPGGVEFLEKIVDKDMNKRLFESLVMSGHIKTGKIIHRNGDVEIQKIFAIRPIGHA